MKLKTPFRIGCMVVWSVKLVINTATLESTFTILRGCDRFWCDTYFTTCMWPNIITISEQLESSFWVIISILMAIEYLHLTGKRTDGSPDCSDDYQRCHSSDQRIQRPVYHVRSSSFLTSLLTSVTPECWPFTQEVSLVICILSLVGTLCVCVL